MLINLSGCYVCGVRWKDCACPVWDEQRLLARAERIVERNEQPAAFPRQQQVAAARQYVIEHHECEHEEWDKYNEPAECDECGRDCNRYHYYCSDCDMYACKSRSPPKAFYSRGMEDMI
jgi:hypothetical protein